MAETSGSASATDDLNNVVDTTGPLEHFDSAGRSEFTARQESSNRLLPDAGCQPNQAPSMLDRFLSGFFDERSIKWLLVIGAGIVFGSSLMLVTREWSYWPVSLRFLTVLAYTAAGFGAAEIGRRQLALPTTSLVLHALTLLLLPILFLSLGWMVAGTESHPGIGSGRLLILLVPAAALTWLAGNRIFDFLLAGRQTTFVTSYQLLCVAGIIPQAVSPLWATGLMCGLWLVLTSGVVKVNRHIFRLTEERRVPRVFGFFPIAVLGLQFLTLVGIKCVPALPTEWIGFGCVLLALTVLATARSVADVFRQRTGDLVRPLPWNIVLPVITGLILTTTGVALSLAGLPHGGALIPATALAAVLMAWTGRETKHTGFVWMSLVFVTMAYQFTPTLFRETALQLRDSAAAALGEKRLPIAFYGLTYLPLLTCLALGSRYFRRRADTVFGRPLQQFTTVLLLALFAVSVTNIKAMLAVSAVHVSAFTGMAVVFADRRYILGSIAAIYTAGFSLIPCINELSHRADISPAAPFTVLAVISAVMTASPLFDRLINSIPTARGFLHPALVRTDGTARNLCQLSGCVVATILVGRWMVGAAMTFGAGLTVDQLWQFAILMTVFVVSTMRNPTYPAGVVVWMAAGFAGLCYFAGVTTEIHVLCNAASMIAMVTGAVGLLSLRATGSAGRDHSLRDLRRLITSVRRRRHEFRDGDADGRTVQTLAFVVPLCDLSLLISGCLAVLIHLPILLSINFGWQAVFPAPLLHVAVALATVVWLLIAGTLARQRTAVGTAMAILPFCTSAVTVLALQHSVSPGWHAVIWALSAAGCGMMSRHRADAVQTTIARTSRFWLLTVLAISCISFSISMRLAAGIVLASFVADSQGGLSRSKLTWLAIGASVQLLCLAAAAGGVNGLRIPAGRPGWNGVAEFHRSTRTAVGLRDHSGSSCDRAGSMVRKPSRSSAAAHSVFVSRAGNVAVARATSLVLPAGFLHGALRLHDTGPVARPPSNASYAVLYAPAVLLLPVSVAVFRSGSRDFLLSTAGYHVVFLTWLTLANLSAAVMFRKLRDQLALPGSRSLLQQMAGSLVVITALAIVYAVVSDDSTSAPWLRISATLSLLVPTVCFAWSIFHRRLMPLMLERTVGYGAILVGILWLHRVVISPLTSRLSDDLNLDFVLVEFVVLLTLVNQNNFDTADGRTG